MRKLGLPLVLVATLSFMERYRYILAESFARMVTARKARTFSRRGGLTLNLAAGLIGLLFLRAFERAERVHGAMLARGCRFFSQPRQDQSTRKVTSQTPAMTPDLDLDTRCGHTRERLDLPLSRWQAVAPRR